MVKAADVLLLFGLPLLLLSQSLVAQQPARDFVWIEGEAPAAINVKPNIAGWGHSEYLSGGKWLQVSIDADKVDKDLPADGALIRYDFTLPKQADYEIWNRIGFEFVRSPFDWRVDDGAWSTVKPDQLTTDLMELQDWNEAAWLKMGALPLAAGPHSLTIRLTKTRDEKGATAHVLYASDALCIRAGPFHPDSKHQPGDVSWQTDSDRAAAGHAFRMPTPADAAQTALSLKGDWQIARYDEPGLVSDRSAPIKELPAEGDLIWSAIPIPGDRNASRPDLAFCHRYFLRTRIEIPSELAGRSFYLHFPSVNLIASVFVNGQLCGVTDTPFAVWDCDVTKALKPGQVNEITVGIKDTYYAFASKDQNVRSFFNLPISFFHYNATMQFDYPVLSHQQTGILNEPSLVVAGGAYTSDVFAIPSVKNKMLGLEITVANPTSEPISVQVRNEVVPVAGGPVAKTFEPKTLLVPAGGNATLKASESWVNPKLWWPDDPQQYNVVTRLSVDGKEIDARTTKFGFREWDWHGAQFTLNGVPWHGRADLADYSASDLEAAIATWRRHGQTMERFWSEDGWGGMDTEHALDFFDAHGVPIRRTGIFDGEGANGFYGLTEQVQQDGKEVTVARRALFDNWRRQLRAWAKGQRNHPSIFIWSMENEITFINAHVMGLNPYTDSEMRKAAEMLAELDPTRPQMTDGGNALLDQSLPIYGGHYMEPPLTSLPEGAYGTAGFAHRQEWPVTQVKPFLLGESYFATGIDATDLASVGGEAAFVGKAESYPAMGLIGKMLSEGYRWSGINFHFWLGDESDLYYNTWQPIAILCRQWDWTFGSGQRVKRTLKLFNDTRTDQPITLIWTLSIGGKRVASADSLHRIAAGQDETFDVVLPMPQVTSRQEGEWTLALSVGSRQVFKDVKSVSVLLEPTIGASGMGGNGSGDIKSPSRGPSANRPAGRVWVANLRIRVNARQAALRTKRFTYPFRSAGGSLCIYDPVGAAASFLRSLRAPFTLLTSLDRLPTDAKVLIVGKDALNAATSTSSKLAAFAAAGRVVIVLEQRNPLRYQALSGSMTADTKTGLIAFPEDLDHPLLRGLKPKDFVTWGRDGVLYRNAYVKPTSGGKSLIECDSGLQNSALVEMTAGKGLLLLCQLTVEEKLNSCAPARQLLANMIRYGAAYRQTFRPVAVAASDNPPLTEALDATGLQYSRAAGPLQALGRSGSIAIVNASSANLKALADGWTQVHAFTQNGGWIVLNNLTPEGLADFNRLVGVDHIIRPFTREKVTFPPTRNPLTAGLATSNIVLYSGQQIFNFAAGQYVASDAFSYVVDLDDIAPFGKSPFFAYANIVNNFVSADGWPLIIDFPPPTDGKPYNIPITLPRRETIREFKWIGNTMYWPQTKVNLIFDDREKVSFDVKPTNEPQTFALDPPRAAIKVTLQIAGWQELPNVAANIGIDNVYLMAKRSPEFARKVKPMLNIGAMVEYPQGHGGIVLCNVLFKETEAVPENIDKKRAILTAVLRNLQAPYAGRSVIAGAGNLTYQPIDLSKQANQFRTERGWFGDKSFTFADLPTGKHTFAGVPYNVYEFATSPVPTVVMLGGSGIPGGLPEAVTGIPINRRADALFFLQAARIDARRSPDEVRQGKQFEMADYVVHYADGQNVKVPIISEIDIDDYRQQTPAALPGAQIAWTRAYPGTGYSAVAYSMQWNNPRPGVKIRSIDLVYGPDRRGIPALLAITAAEPNPPAPFPKGKGAL